MRRVLMAGAGVAAAVLAGCGGGSSAGTTAGSNAPLQHPNSLVGTSGDHDAFVISMTDDAGADLTNVAAGTYQLVVHDDSTLHDFHLTGPGVDVATPIGEKVVKKFSVKLSPGTYTFVCDPHSSQMHGSFTVH